MDSAALFAPVSEPSAEARAQFAGLADSAPETFAGMGRLAEVGSWLSACQGFYPPRTIERPRVLIFAGDHGVAKQGVDTADPALSVQRAEELTAGQSPVNALATAAGAGVRLVDVSLNHEAWGDERVSAGSGCIDTEDAMTLEQFERALAIGRQIADQEVDFGADLLLPGSLGVAGETVATALAGALTRTEPVAVVGAGYGMTEQLWKQRVKVVRDAMFRVRSDIDQPLEVLRKISSPDFAALVAFCAQAAVRRTPVLIDGPLATVAAMFADRLAPGARAWFLAAQASATPSQAAALRDLGLQPLLDLQFDLGAGTGALAALPLLQTAGILARDAVGVEPEPN
ncbi:nicotinate-nucleotide--dimethylbenzimidazole phosphoribosyltransferase [Corynebacterium sp. A21]|uniref:nicotinate-nucleotide--dimethylbenzimidazole phosphoribosyltransferase n=1 Tax=Corynebacterium sp. A21 TaxID=3457318 RepID=UPI003FD58C9C